MRVHPAFTALRALAFLVVLSTAACTSGDSARLGDSADGPAEADAGDWITLFDGTSMDGWSGYLRDDVPEAWSVEDGAITFTPGRSGGDLMAPGTYGDFELALEYRVGECGNSGVVYHIEEREALRDTWQSGLEMQVLDNSCHPDAQYPSHRAGALYDLYTPTADASRGAGEWNQALIRVEDGALTHTLNGQTVVTAQTGTDDWRARIAASKFRDGAKFPGFGTRTSGAIALQDHGDPVAFRDIRIRRL